MNSAFRKYDNSNIESLRLNQLFQKIQDNEKVGISIQNDWLNNIPTFGENIPEAFQENDKVVKCLNYPGSNEAFCRDFNPNSMEMFGFVQICSQNQELTDTDESASNIHFPELTSNIKSNNKKKKKKGAYARCAHHFKEAMD